MSDPGVAEKHRSYLLANRDLERDLASDAIAGSNIVGMERVSCSVA
jgi:hypothetical protein